ncbi:MAG: nuclear transport factor 2 family protein [Hydrogenophaga sp.]|nr:nuclear transport factor 2 family protein [Hydrogenophaga sp.]
MTASDPRAAVVRIATYFESLTPQSVAQIGDFYTAQARFKDPFNEVQGIPAITHIFQHMFVALHEPRFVVTHQIVDGPQAFLAWEFRFRFKRFDTVTQQVVRGGSHLTLAPDGRISDHRDYWDAAEELYEKLPVVSGLMRWLKARANS